MDPRPALQDGNAWNQWLDTRLDEELLDGPDNESENQQKAVHRKDSSERSTTGSGIEPYIVQHHDVGFSNPQVQYKNNAIRGRHHDIHEN